MVGGVDGDAYKRKARPSGNGAGFQVRSALLGFGT